jgi:hypothetical protein
LDSRHVGKKNSLACLPDLSDEWSSRKPLLAKEKTMTSFTIDAENNITAYPNATDAS